VNCEQSSYAVNSFSLGTNVPLETGQAQLALPRKSIPNEEKTLKYGVLRFQLAIVNQK